MQRSVDATASTVTIRTRATGPLARLAHDLEIALRGVSGAVTDDGEGFRAEFTFPVASMAVVGVVRGGRVDRTVLASRDVAEIERKLRADVLRGAEVRVEARGDRRRADLVVRAPQGQVRTSVAIEVHALDGGELVVQGRIRLSLSQLGCPEVKGPLGAFKVADEIEVDARLRLSGGLAGVR